MGRKKEFDEIFVFELCLAYRNDAIFGQQNHLQDPLNARVRRDTFPGEFFEPFLKELDIPTPILSWPITQNQMGGKCCSKCLFNGLKSRLSHWSLLPTGGRLDTFLYQLVAFYDKPRGPDVFGIKAVMHCTVSYRPRPMCLGRRGLNWLQAVTYLHITARPVPGIGLCPQFHACEACMLAKSATIEILCMLPVPQKAINSPIMLAWPGSCV